MCNLARQWLTLRLLERLPVERFFEVGFGAGDVLCALGRRGLRGAGIDFSEEAARACQERLRAEGLEGRLRVACGDLASLPDEVGRDYDLAIAFEVLEHIEDDVAALGTLRRLLRPGGYLLLSVPAHRRQWGATDVWAGHVRRYERAELQEKLARSGFAVREFFSYGFPLLNLTRRLRNLIYARDLRRGDSARERSARSGIARPAGATLFRPLIPPFAWLVYQTQRPFLHSDLGEGYLVLAQREDKHPANANADSDRPV